MATEAGSLPAAVIHRALEGAVSISQQHRDIVAPRIRHGQVQVIVSIKVADGEQKDSVDHQRRNSPRSGMSRLHCPKALRHCRYTNSLRPGQGCHLH